MAGEEETATEQVIKVSIFTPLIYVGILMAAFITFSVLYRKNRLKKLAKVEPIFGENYPLNLYQFLKSQHDNPEIAKDQKPHDRVLKAALLRRGVEGVRRSLKLKEIEPAFTKLYQEGLIGEEVFKNFEIQARFQEIELKSIVQEVESFKKGWAQTFFPVAQEICFNEALRRRLAAEDDRAKTFSTMWEYYAETSEKPKLAEKTSEKGEKN